MNVTKTQFKFFLLKGGKYRAFTLLYLILPLSKRGTLPILSFYMYAERRLM